MDSVFTYESTTMLIILFVLLAVKIFAFVSSLTYTTEAYPAAGKATKAAWCIGLGVGLLVQLVIQSPLSIFSIVFTIAAFVYLADVRPALSSLRRR